MDRSYESSARLDGRRLICSLDDRITWLERAKLAKRYEPRHFPYSNLGSIYERKGRWREAMREYKEALQHEPHHQPTLKAVARLRAQMN
jgi:Tfp pilus assembly protein PilF